MSKPDLPLTGEYGSAHTTQAVTGATWVSSNPAVATVSSTGHVAALKAGIATISARYGGFEADVTVTVPERGPTAIRIDPATLTLTKGSARGLTVLGTYSDGERSVTDGLTWSSSSTAVTVDQTGRSVAAGPGTATITATYGTLTATSVVTVPATLTSIVVTPVSPTVKKKRTLQLTATGEYDDGTTRDLTTLATWTALDPSLATVSTSGLVTGVSKGAARVTTAYAGISTTTTVQVANPSVTKLTITPGSVSVKVGGTSQLKAVATYSDGSTVDVTKDVDWVSSNVKVATVTKGLVTGKGKGSTTMKATCEGVSATAAVTVT